MKRAVPTWERSFPFPHSLQPIPTTRSRRDGHRSRRFAWSGDPRVPTGGHIAGTPGSGRLCLLPVSMDADRVRPGGRWRNAVDDPGVHPEYVVERRPCRRRGPTQRGPHGRFLRQDTTPRAEDSGIAAASIRLERGPTRRSWESRFACGNLANVAAKGEVWAVVPVTYPPQPPEDRRGPMRAN